MKPKWNTEPLLDDALVEQLNEAVAEGGAASDAAALARIKRRVLERIATDNTPRHVTHPPGDEGWQPFGAGLRIKVLHEAGGVMCCTTASKAQAAR